MSEHLPECEPDLQLPDGSFIACICDRLRACEQRVEDTEALTNHITQYRTGYARGLIEGDSGGRREGHRIGYVAGVQAARDAVLAVRAVPTTPHGQMRYHKRDCLAAIDALRGESNG